MRIGIDVDGVVADNHTAWLRRVNEAYGTKWTPYDLTQWEFWKDLGLTQAELFKFWTADIYAEEVRPYPGARKALESLGAEVEFITSCFSEAEFSAKEKWLQRFCSGSGLVWSMTPVGPPFTFTTKREVAHALGVSWLVDDSVANCEAWPYYALLLTRPHNRLAMTSVKRVKSLEEVVELAKWSGMITDPQIAEISQALSMLPSDAEGRKDTPVGTGVLDYFGAALAEVARVSKAGNDQHNPGQPLHWAWGKSKDHYDCVTRHLMERGLRDTDGQRHTAKAAWRVLALLTEELVAEGAPLPRAAKVG